MTIINITLHTYNCTEHSTTEYIYLNSSDLVYKELERLVVEGADVHVIGVVHVQWMLGGSDKWPLWFTYRTLVRLSNLLLG